MKNEVKDTKDFDKPVSRRSILKAMGISAIAASLPLDPAQAFDWDAFLQKHFKELSPEELKKVIARLEKDVKEKYGKDSNIKTTPAMDGVEFAYALNLSKCVGCRRCVYACVEENNQSRDPQIQYIRVLEMEKGSLDVEESNHYYNPEEVPREGKYYMPVQCHQCRRPECVKVCPVEATWKEPDGIVVIDYNWCIGCRYCEAACPYFARRFNFAEPQIAAEELNTEMHYLGNRPRPRGVMEKCTFCIQRTREGRYPACLEICPTGSRKFGNFLDPESEVRRVIENKRVFVLKEEVGTHPRFYYFFDF